MSVTTSMSRRPPPYQETLQAARSAGPAAATVAAGVGNFSPFLRGRWAGRLPVITGGGSYSWASGTNRLTSVSRRRCRCANRAISWLP